MIDVTFVDPDGGRTAARAAGGTPLLAVGQAVGMPLEGTCEGHMACSTCHVIVDRAWIGRLPEPSADEEDMLDLAAGVTATSRLSCQVLLTDALDGLVVHIPREANDMQVR